MTTDNDYYFTINIAIGIGIAADAVVATIARAQTLRSFRDAIKWACAIGLTHWLFPMIGFLGGWYLASHGVARALVYGFGGVILLTYVIRVLHERSSLAVDDQSLPSRISFWLAVWGVSVDALVTGPGKAAATAHWTRAEVALSFPLVGAVVFTLVLLSTVPAMLLHRVIGKAPGKSSRALSLFFVVATWIELVVFTWFAMLSGVEAAGAMRILTPSYSLASGCAAVISGTMLILSGSKVWRAQAAAGRNLLRS